MDAIEESPNCAISDCRSAVKFDWIKLISPWVTTGHLSPKLLGH